MEAMQRVNVFAEQRNGETSYRSGIFSRKKTIEEILHFYGLSVIGANVYANSKSVEVHQTLADLMPGPVCFLSCIYGEQKLPKRKS